MRLFVYGTLLSGASNHRRLRGSRLLGVYRTEPRYTLVSLGAYPALLDGGTTTVTGEVYEVEDRILPAVDRFEGHPHLYVRKGIALLGGTQADGYVLQPVHGAPGKVIESGNWRQSLGQ